MNRLTDELRNARMMVNRGNGDVGDDPDPLHEAAADEIERLTSRVVGLEAMLIPSVEFLPAISMWQPYASLMFAWDRERGEFAKANETRSHKLPDRLINEWVVIHATAKFAPATAITAELNDLCYDMFGCGYNFSLPRGAAIGMVRFGVPVPTGELAPFQPDGEIAAGDWSPGRWAWPVMEVKLFDTPVPMKGAQGWWRFPAIAMARDSAETACPAPVLKDCQARAESIAQPLELLSRRDGRRSRSCGY